MSQLVWTFLGGKLVQTVTSITLVNNTLKEQDTIVPAGKRWLLLNVKALNPDDVDRTIYIRIYKEAAKTNLLRSLAGQPITAASAEIVCWPSNTTSTTTATYVSLWTPVILEAGNTISVRFEAGGVSAGGTDADGLVVEYLEIDA